ncbi:unnamed protein product [Heligmosomoides polygyrus]|uniref:Coronin n=1 Tax=Heligmosomoides polygyrus TaxID=6339 RepID=A0A183GS12_HELPZ|nr:unnamed protein product [Heligmosomoides polygyrus]
MVILGADLNRKSTRTRKRNLPFTYTCSASTVHGVKKQGQNKTEAFQVGRIDKDYPFVDAHKAPCLEVVWSPFNDNVIASCSEDTTAKVWLIPEKGLMRNLSEPVVELCGHQKRVNTLAWHPVANNLLLTAGSFSASHLVGCRFLLCKS